MKFKPEDFESAFGITRHDYKIIQNHLTWRELCQRASDAANDKAPFNIGDRVRVYGYRLLKAGYPKETRYSRGDIGVVTHLTCKNEIIVDFDDGTDSEVHPKQVRKIKRK